MGSAVRRSVATVVVVLAAAGAALPGGAATVRPIVPGYPDPGSYRALVAEVDRNRARLAQLAGQIDETARRLTELDASLAETRAALDAARAEIARLESIVRTRAADIYTRARSPRLIFEIGRVEDVAAGTRYARSATLSDVHRIDGITAIAETLDERLHELTAERAREQRTYDDLVASKASLETATEKQRALLDDAGRITVMGDSLLTGAEIAAWFDARGARYRLSGHTTIRELAELFVEEGAAENVRGDVAFAQAVLETGSFGRATDNNFAGIGACDSCRGQIAFGSPRDGVRGQVQMLRNYADPTSRAANLANPPSAPIYGRDPLAAAAAYDTFFAKGRAPTWNLMGNGNWATDPGYAPKVLGIYFEMVAFAARRT